jgi:hypothetical protein
VPSIPIEKNDRLKEGKEAFENKTEPNEWMQPIAGQPASS